MTQAWFCPACHWTYLSPIEISGVSHYCRKLDRRPHELRKGEPPQQDRLADNVLGFRKRGLRR